MDSEVKMLREALKKCSGFVAIQQGKDSPLSREITLALCASSGELPEEYETEYSAGRYYIWHNGKELIENDRQKFCWTEFAARLYCWQQVAKE